MFPVRVSSTQFVWVGEEMLAKEFSGRAEESEATFDLEVVGTETAVAESELDCLVVDSGAEAVDATTVLERLQRDRPDVPVVVLTDGWSDDRVADTLSRGATMTVPRRLVADDPDLFADRLVAAVESEHGATSFRALYDSIAGFATVHDPASGELLHANQSFCDFLGHDRDAVLSMQVGDFTAEVPGYDQDRATNVVSRVAERDDPLEIEWPIRTSTESIRWVDATLKSVRIGGRSVVLSTSVDITERRQQERTYEQVFNNVNDVIAVHDPWAGQLVDVNETLCELTGYSREALLEMDIEGFSAVADGYTGEAAYGIQQDVAASGESQTVDWVIETVTGEQRRLESVLTPATIEGEDRVLALSRDVTERRQLEETYRELFENVSDGLVIHDFETGEIRDVNERFCEMNGYERDELVGETADIVTAPDHEFGRAREKIEAARTKGPQLFEWRNQRKNGDTFPVEVHLSVVDIRGEERVLGSVRDITERKRREREYEQIFNGVTEAIAIQDPETGELLDANQTFVDRLGYDDVETVRELGIEALSATDDGFTREKARTLCQRVSESGEAETVEWTQETNDGDRIWIEAQVNPAVIRGEDRIVSMQRDVTKRRRREREYEQIFNRVNDAITVFDPETADILDVNDTYHEMLGYDDIERIRELGIGGLSVSDERFTGERGTELIREVAETGVSTIVEWRAQTRAGDQIWLEVTLTPAEIGGETRVLSIQRDITERKRREREYEQIFNDVTDAITVHDPETGDLVDFNETMCALTGYDRSELLGEGQGAVNVPEAGYSKERAKAIVQEVMAAGEERTFEWVIERADGERRWLEVNATPSTVNGEERYLAMMRDVTEQRRTERRLREILERIDEAIYLTRAAELTNPILRPDDLSAGYESIWGESLQDIFERYDSGFFDTLHPDEESGFREFVEDIGADVADGSTDDRYGREYRIVRHDGEVRWVKSDFYLIEWPTGPLRVVIVSRDITSRKARERRMASFDDATDDLATADTPEEATRSAVEAATEALDLPAVGAFLYDDEDGVLRPEVLDGPLASGDVTAPIGPGDGPLWEGFATGTVVSSDGGQRESGFVGPGDRTPGTVDELVEWRAIGLGNHGLLLVGSQEQPLEPETIQTAHVLAATLEAALNHLEGQQRLAAQEEQLRTQTERAERLDRIAGLIQKVEAAITETSNPGQVERAVCERLASGGPYDLAWIGGVDVGSDRLSPRAVTGSPDQYVEEMNLATTDDRTDPHPAVAAWRSGDAQVADSLVGTGPAGQWRQQALSAGYQSLCAVPVTYDGVTHGVLTVGTDSPNAFGDRERDVLAQLGVSIANALAAIERRRALESDETVELEFHGPGDALSFAQAADAADCRVRLERTVARRDGSVSVYFGFEGDVPTDAPAIAKRAFGGSVEAVSDESSTLVEVQTDDWFGSPLAEYGGVLREAAAEAGETTVTVEVPKQADVRSFADRLRSIAPSLELVARRQHRQQDWTPTELTDQVRTELTDRQFEVVQTALSEGYFEWPRRNDGSDVASQLDITQPTLNKHLRLAEKKTFNLLFDAEG